MKYLVSLLFILTLSVSGYSQIERSKMVGTWKYQETLSGNRKDTTRINFSIELELLSSGQLQMRSDFDTSGGAWMLEGSTLVMKREKKGDTEYTRIHSCKDDVLELEFPSNAGETLIFVFRRKK